ncbi:molybdenum cofactor guanylyltransferase [Evansella sp. AB-rgal1]|uniref:molybdenum cofactor guanylyltransferase n=1 Tax=Evansella sp. AB-rgal1 TaxID=3242696 RepID=UPI00359EDF3D
MKKCKNITGIVLAGGKSKRMGQNKALLEIKGEKSILRILEKLERITSNIIINTNSPEEFQFLSHDIVEDEMKDKGPLGGIYSSLVQSSSIWNFIVACDLPHFNDQIAQYLVSLIEKNNVQCVIPVIDERIHPLYGVYNKSVLSTVKKHIENNSLKITEVLRELTMYSVTEKELLANGFSEKEIEKAFFNMNRPEDYLSILSSPPYE